MIPSCVEPDALEPLLAAREGMAGDSGGADGRTRPSATILGLRLARFSFSDALDEIARLVESGGPSYFITANLNYCMLSATTPELREVNDRAAFILADGMPLVWYSSWRGTRLPDRVTGADLLPAICALAAQRGWRVLLLGGSPGVGDTAAKKLGGEYAGLSISAVEAPALQTLSAADEINVIERVRARSPQVILAALGQPSGEIWLARNCRALGAAVCAQFGASVDFAAGRIPRAPHWMQRSGLEWAYRLYREPTRLAGRYFRNAMFFVRCVTRETLVRGGDRRAR